MSKSLTEAAKAVLEGKSQIEEGYGINYPSVGSGGVSNPNPVDPSTASTGVFGLDTRFCDGSWFCVGTSAYAVGIHALPTNIYRIVVNRIFLVTCISIALFLIF